MPSEPTVTAMAAVLDIDPLPLLAQLGYDTSAPLGGRRPRAAKPVPVLSRVERIEAALAKVAEQGARMEGGQAKVAEQVAEVRRVVTRLVEHRDGR